MAVAQPARRRGRVPWTAATLVAAVLIALTCPGARSQPPPVHAAGLAKMAHVRSRFPSFGGFDTHNMHFRSPDASAARTAASSRFLRTATTSRKSPRGRGGGGGVTGGDSGELLQQAYSSDRIRPAATGAGAQQHQDADAGAIDVDDFDPFGGGMGPPHAPHTDEGPHLLSSGIRGRTPVPIRLPGGGVNSVTGAPLLSPLHDMFRVRPPAVDAASELLNARDAASDHGHHDHNDRGHHDHAAPGSPFEGPAANFHAAPTPVSVVDYSGHHLGQVTDASGRVASVGQSPQVHGAPPPPPPPPPPMVGAGGSTAAAGGSSRSGLGGGSSAVVGSHPSYPLAGLSGNGASKLFGGAELSSFMPSPIAHSSGEAAGGHGRGPPLPTRPPV